VVVEDDYVYLYIKLQYKDIVVNHME